MATAAKNTTMSRQAGRAKPTDSVVASLAGRATAASAAATPQDGLKTGNNFTGQYLYDTFIGDGEKFEASKMDVVRAMVKNVDTQAFKKLLGEFVGVAKSYADKAENAAKQAGLYIKDQPTPEMSQAQARLKTARNCQTVMRTAYGALKFAGDRVAELGGSEQAGYNLMSTIGKRALADKGINWDGTKAEDADSRQARAAQAREAAAVAKAMEENPRKDGEDRAKYLDRVLKVADKAMKAEQEEQHGKQLADLVAKVKALAGPMLEEVLDSILQPAPAAPAPDAALH